MYRSWGYCPSTKQEAVRPSWRDFVLADDQDSVLPYGNGRSYGDSCLNSKGRVIDSRSLNKFISLDKQQGVLRCEVGVTFQEILQLIVPTGWFLPVTPGTKFVTVGGAIANDVHGKNHHRDGTFGRHVLSFELLRSDEGRILCSKDNHSELFRATIGGLGLTGFITWAEIQLIPIRSVFVEVETIAFNGLEEFYELSADSHQQFQYTVAWLDCVAKGDNFTRGLFMRANHAEQTESSEINDEKRHLTVPFHFPKWCLNRYSIGMFNSVYFHSNKCHTGEVVQQHYDPFFYPLDGINDWYRIYGKEGFYQYQFVIPKTEAKTMEKILKQIVSSGLGSFLAVLKEFGDLDSPGMLSFPRPGICLALDFSNRGSVTKEVLNQLDELVMQAGGAVYPAKDNRMSGKAFKTYFPQYQDFIPFIDPKFSSDFWQRVNA